MAKRKSGQRTRSGRLRNRAAPHDHGNERVVLRTARFAVFQGGKAGQQVSDPIGRAWAAGLFDNDRVDPAVLRDAGRAYAARYWGHYGSAAGVANYDGISRKGRGLADGDPDRAGRIFAAMDARLTDAGNAARAAVHGLCVDPFHFPDTDPGWLERLLDAALRRVGRPAAAPAADRDDETRMAAAIAGLLALAEGMASRRAA